MRHCPVCSSSRTRIRWTGLGDRLFRTTEERFDVRCCDDCRAFFLDDVPPPERLARYYPSDYWVRPPEAGATGRRGGLLERYRMFVLRDHVRFVRRVLDRQRAGGMEVRVLDVGCGDGSFLDALGEPTGIGMDQSLPAMRAARARGIDVLCGRLDGLPLREGAFSLVTAFHFLEHVHPVEPVLERMRALLAPGGDLVVQVPNTRSWQARGLGRRWAGFDVPRHLVDYSAGNLRRKLEECGFTVVAENHHCLRDNPTALANSLVPSLFPPARISRGGRPTGAAAALANLAYLGLTLACMPFSIAEALCGRGASVMVHARPR